MVGNLWNVTRVSSQCVLVSVTAESEGVKVVVVGDCLVHGTLQPCLDQVNHLAT